MHYKERALIMHLRDSVGLDTLKELLLYVAQESTRLTNVIGDIYTVELDSGIEFIDKLIELKPIDVNVDAFGNFEVAYEFVFNNEGTVSQFSIKRIKNKSLEDWLLSLKPTPIS